MNHLKWMGHSATIFEIQKTLRNDPGSCEVTLVGANATVRAHRFVLSSCSELLRAALRDIPQDQEATIIVPDIRGALLDSVLAFIYMGETNITSTNLSEFLEAINTLGIRSAISFECNASAAMSSTTTQTITNATTNNMPGDGAIPIKTISGIEMAQHEELLDPEQMEQKIVSLPHRQSHIITATTENTTARELDFLEVYGNESQQQQQQHQQQQPKITYSIGHMPVTAAGSEFILTETAGTFTFTQNAKLEEPSTNDLNAMDDGNDDEDCEDDCEKIVETEEDDDGVVGDDDDEEGQIMDDDYSSGGGGGGGEGVGNSAVMEITGVAAPVEVDGRDGVLAATIVEMAKPIRRRGPRSKSSKQMKNTAGNNRNFNSSTEAANTPIIKLDAYNTNSTTISYEEQTVGIEQTIDMAVSAVINEGISLQKAAVKFDLSKTVLWRRVRKHPDYMKTNRENPILSVACERLKSGDSLKTISRDLDIPMSTLHRHKVRLAQQGRLPDYITFRKRDAVTRDELKRKLMKAVHACVHDGMSQNHAANMFEIPKSTLWRHLQKRVAEAEQVEGIDEIKEELILS